MISDRIPSTTYVAPPITAPRHPSGLVPRLREAMREWLGVETAKAVVPLEETPELTEEQSDWPSIDVVYDEIQEMAKAQNDRLKTIDTKANFGLAAATLLTAGVTGLGRALAESGQRVASQAGEIGTWTISVNQLVDLVTIASLGIYALIAFSTYIAYRIRTYRDLANPTRLMEVYLYKDPSYTKAAIANQRAKNFTTNEVKLNDKATWVNRAMILLIVEAVLLIAIAVLQVIWL